MTKLIGYARVSTRQQSTVRQQSDLLASGVRRDDLYVDHGSAQEAGLGLDEWTADRQRGREVYEMYARHFSALTGMSVRSHLEKAFPAHDYAYMEG